MATLCAGKPPAALLIDLDGTLVDSAPDLADAVDATLVGLGLEAAGEGKVRGWVGDGAAMLLRRALASAMACDDESVEERQLASALAQFFDHYEQLCCHSTAVYSGVHEALREFSRCGVALACVTNKPGRFTDKLLAHLGLDHYFGAVVSGDSLVVKKPDPAPLQLAAKSLGVVLAQCAMVGDSATDVQAARNAGIPAIVVSYGYSRGCAASELGADRVVDDLRQLLESAIA